MKRTIKQIPDDLKKVVVYPYLKYPDKETLGNNEELARFITGQILMLLHRIGVKDNPGFYRDLDLTLNSIESMLKRASGEHHDLQDLTDDMEWFAKYVIGD